MIQAAYRVSLACITVTDVKGGRVRLSIDAPRSVRVMRQEILLGQDSVPSEESVEPVGAHN